MIRLAAGACLSVIVLAAIGCGPKDSQFVRIPGGTTALTHVRIIDGTGAPARANQSIVIDGAKIREIGEASSISTNGIERVIDLSGQTVFPGLVGMHDHLFYALPSGGDYREMLTVFPKLYLAAGVTTVRTTGTLDLKSEYELKQRIDSGKEAGPNFYLSTPYVDPDPRVPEDSARWVELIKVLRPVGLNSVKIYMRARPSEIAAVVAVAHANGIQVTGHLCATGFTQAAELGIDDLEHGLIVDTEFYSAKQPGICPDANQVLPELIRKDVRGPDIQRLIHTLVDHHVAVTSTLPVFESYAGSRLREFDDRALPLLAPGLQNIYRRYRAEKEAASDPMWGPAFKMEMKFEREFVKAGGLLLAGVDPTGWGASVAGLGDQHEVELLVEAGFTAEEAIRIATYNGASFLKQTDAIGTLEKGKHADIVAVTGDLNASIKDIRRTTLVFKDGVAYDAPAWISSFDGRIGR